MRGAEAASPLLAARHQRPAAEQKTRHSPTGSDHCANEFAALSQRSIKRGYYAVAANIFKTRCNTNVVVACGPGRCRCKVPLSFALIDNDPALYRLLICRYDGDRLRKQRPI